MQNFWEGFELFISEKQSQVDVIFLSFVGLRKRKSLLFMFQQKAGQVSEGKVRPVHQHNELSEILSDEFLLEVE